MRAKIIAAAVLGIVLYSCSPKVVVSAQKPDPVQVPAKLPSMGETKPRGEKLAVGKMLYENNCAKCHKLYSPNDYTQKAWAPILVRMQKKAGMDDSDMAEISNYIYSYM